MDVRTIYCDAQARALALLDELPPAAHYLTVAGTPAWTIADLVSHLCGVACDLVSGNLDGVATEPWTARQVAERRGRSMAEVTDEWRAATPALLDLLAVPGRADAAAYDLLTHEHDLRGALGLPGPGDGAAVGVVTSRVVRSVAGRIDAARLPALRLVADDRDWVCGSGEVAVSATASTMEWFRALFGRRSAGQIATYGWDGRPEPYHPVLNLFGPLPAGPVAEAGAPSFG